MLERYWKKTTFILLVLYFLFYSCSVERRNLVGIKKYNLNASKIVPLIDSLYFNTFKNKEWKIVTIKTNLNNSFFEIQTLLKEGKKGAGITVTVDSASTLQNTLYFLEGFD